MSQISLQITAPQQRITINGQQQIAFYTRNLAGKLPLVLLHGFCEDTGVWSRLLPLLDETPLVCIDLPGFGGSGLPREPTIKAYADAVLAVLDHLNIPQAVLVGHSMGGYTALEFAALHPARLAGWGLLHSHPYADTPDRIENRERGIALLKDGKKDMYVAQLFPGLFTPRFCSEHPDILEALVARGRAQSAEGIIAALEAMIGRKDHLHTLETAKCPVLLFFGEADNLVPKQWALDLMHRPAVAEIDLLPEVAHMGMFEAPEKTATAVLRFYEICKA